jgi:hypothetical protein
MRIHLEPIIRLRKEDLLMLNGIPPNCLQADC